MIRTGEGTCEICRPLLERVGRLARLARVQASVIHRIEKHGGEWVRCVDQACVDARQLLDPPLPAKPSNRALL